MASPVEVYRLTRKKHDQVWNTYVMRPIAAAVVAAIHRTPITPNQITILSFFFALTGSLLLAFLPTYEGGLIAVAVLELAYLFDCVDGMLARYKKLASPTGHLFDFFVDEQKASLLVAVIGMHLHRSAGIHYEAPPWPPGTPIFLYVGLAGAVIVSSGISLTNFVRRPELTGHATPTEAHYEAIGEKRPQSAVAKIGALVMTFLRFLNHYPSHIWIFALAGRLDLFLWMYVGLNALYLGRGWLGLVLRFGRP